MFRSFTTLLSDALPAAAGVTVAQVAGTIASAPSWLTGLGQAVIVVVFTLRGIDKRNQRLADAVAEVRGELETIRGRMNGLACQTFTPDPCKH